MRRFFLGLAVAVLAVTLTSTAQAADWGHGYQRGHYDYVPGHYDRHRLHYDYVPGHYDYHRGGHRDYYSSPGYHTGRSVYPTSGYYGAPSYPGRPYNSRHCGY